MLKHVARNHYRQEYQRQSRNMTEIPAMVMRLAGYCRYRNIPIEVFEELPFGTRFEIVALAVDFDAQAAFDVLRWFQGYEGRYNTIDLHHDLSNAPIPTEFGRPYWAGLSDYNGNGEQPAQASRWKHESGEVAPNPME